MKVTINVIEGPFSSGYHHDDDICQEFGVFGVINDRQFIASLSRVGNSDWLLAKATITGYPGEYPKDDLIPRELLDCILIEASESADAEWNRYRKALEER